MNKRMIAGLLAVSLAAAGCSQSSPQTPEQTEPQESQSQESQTTTQEQEPEEEQSTSDIPDSLILVKAFPEIPEDFVPLTVGTAFLIETSDGNLQLAGSNGDLVSEESFENAVFVGDNLLLSTGDKLYNYNTSTGALMETEGGLGGADTSVYVYDPQTKEVLYSSGQEENPGWSQAGADNISATNMVIYSKECYEQNKDTQIPADNDYYIWDIPAGKVYGPYSGNSGWIFQEPEADITYDHTSGNHICFDGMIPIQEEEGWKAAQGTQVSGKTYTSAVPIALDQLLVSDDSGSYILPGNINDPIQVNQEAGSVSGFVGSSVFVLNNGVWQLYSQSQK